jgi:hypothetical protein
MTILRPLTIRLRLVGIGIEEVIVIIGDKAFLASIFLLENTQGEEMSNSLLERGVTKWRGVLV